MQSFAEGTPPPIAGSLSALLASPVVNDDELSELLTKAESLSGATFFIYDFLREKTLHIGAGIAALSGYTPKETMEGGPALVLRITNPADLPYLMLLQTGYVQEAKSAGFDPRSVRFHDYYWSIASKAGTLVPVLSTGLVLTYSPEHDFHLSAAFHILNDANCDAKAMECKELLRRIKQRHNEIHHHSDKNPTQGLYTTYHVNPIVDSITQRERQVLGMLAQGHSTDVIAVALHIAVNTVESHRKKLLQKFEAKNAAELIKKASKVFWL
jgi:DNA-binding CsgD family transcriptional regulator